VPRSPPLSYGDGWITENPLGPSTQLVRSLIRLDSLWTVKVDNSCIPVNVYQRRTTTALYNKPYKSPYIFIYTTRKTWWATHRCGQAHKRKHTDWNTYTRDVCMGWEWSVLYIHSTYIQVYVSMYVCTFTCLYACMHVRMYACICVCTYVWCMCVCVYVCMYVDLNEWKYECTCVCVIVYVNMYTHMYILYYSIYICICICICMYMYVYMYSYVCICICMCMYIYYFYHQWIGRQDKKFEIKCIPEWCKRRFLLKNISRRPKCYGNKCAAGKTYPTKCASGQIFWLSPDHCVLLIQYVIYFMQITAQNLLLLINELINLLIDDCFYCLKQ